MDPNTHIRSTWILKLGYTPGSTKANWHRWGLGTFATGSQPGVDRAVLDVAPVLPLPSGSWCPRGRWAEDGMIDALLSLRETLLTRVIHFVRANGLTVLNTGGPRESEDPGIYRATRAFLFALFSPCWSLIIATTQPRSGANSP